MRTLMCLDEKNYTDDMPLFLKYAVRAVIIRDGRIAMQKAKAGYYKISLYLNSQLVSELDFSVA